MPSYHVEWSCSEVIEADDAEAALAKARALFDRFIEGRRFAQTNKSHSFTVTAVAQEEGGAGTINAVDMTENNEAPVEIIGWDEDEEILVACRAGEPSFVGAQDLGDAYQAALVRGVELLVPRAVWNSEFPDGGPELSNVRLI